MTAWFVVLSMLTVFNTAVLGFLLIRQKEHSHEIKILFRYCQHEHGHSRPKSGRR